MDLFNDAMISGLCKKTTIQAFIGVLQRKINTKSCFESIPYKGVDIPLVLESITSYIPELYNVNEISPDNWRYFLQAPFHGKMDFDTCDPQCIDFRSYFSAMDILSIPILFNRISNQTGIYKLSCVCDKNISLTIGLANKGSFDEKIYDGTRSDFRCFWPQDIFGVPDSDLVCLSNEGHPRVKGNLRIHAGESKISESVKLKNTKEVNLTIIWDSYKHIVYFYENNRCIEKLCFEETDTEFVPFIYLYYDRTYPKSDCLVSLSDMTLKFKVDGYADRVMK